MILVFLYVFVGGVCQTPTNFMGNTIRALNILLCQDRHQESVL